MCLVNSETATKRLKARMRANHGKLTCWKVYDVKDGLLCSVINDHAKGGTVQHGVIVSNRIGRAPGADAQDAGTPHVTIINRGIHVYTDHDGADPAEWEADAAVPVQCDLDDLVGASIDGQAVFTQVRLLKKDFDAAVGAKA